MKEPVPELDLSKDKTATIFSVAILGMVGLIFVFLLLCLSKYAFTKMAICLQKRRDRIRQSREAAKNEPATRKYVLSKQGGSYVSLPVDGDLSYATLELSRFCTEDEGNIPSTDLSLARSRTSTEIFQRPKEHVHNPGHAEARGVIGFRKEPDASTVVLEHQGGASGLGPSLNSSNASCTYDGSLVPSSPKTEHLSPRNSFEVDDEAAFKSVKRSSVDQVPFNDATNASARDEAVSYPKKDRSGSDASRRSFLGRFGLKKSLGDKH